MNLVSFSLCLLEFLGYFIVVAVTMVVCLLVVFLLLCVSAVIVDKLLDFLEDWW